MTPRIFVDFRGPRDPPKPIFFRGAALRAAVSPWAFPFGFRPAAAVSPWAFPFGFRPAAAICPLNLRLVATPSSPFYPFCILSIRSQDSGDLGRPAAAARDDSGPDSCFVGIRMEFWSVPQKLPQRNKFLSRPSDPPDFR